MGDSKMLLMFGLGFTMLVLGLVMYMQRETNDFVVMTDKTKSLELDLKRLSEISKEDYNSLKIFHNDLLGRVVALEKGKPEVSTVKLSSPVQIEVIRKHVPTPVKKGKGKQALLERSGIIARENN
jgi:hypothetical protein